MSIWRVSLGCGPSPLDSCRGTPNPFVAWDSTCQVFLQNTDHVATAQLWTCHLLAQLLHSTPPRTGPSLIRNVSLLWGHEPGISDGVSKEHSFWSVCGNVIVHGALGNLLNWGIWDKRGEKSFHTGPPVPRGNKMAGITLLPDVESQDLCCYWGGELFLIREESGRIALLYTRIDWVGDIPVVVPRTSQPFIHWIVALASEMLVAYLANENFGAETGSLRWYMERRHSAMQQGNHSLQKWRPDSRVLMGPLRPSP